MYVNNKERVNMGRSLNPCGTLERAKYLTKIVDLCHKIKRQYGQSCNWKLVAVNAAECKKSHQVVIMIYDSHI